jgi:integrase
VIEYRDADGKRHLKSFATKKEAVAEQEKIRGDVRDGTHVPASKSITVKEAAEEWIAAVGRGRKNRGPAEASTLRQCRYHVDRYIAPKLGRVKLAQLTRQRVMSFRDDLLGSISRPLAKKVLGSLKGILSEAKDRQRVAINAASGITVGSGARGKQEVEIPAIADIKAILIKLDEQAAASPTWLAWRRWRAILATAIYTGMRASEVRGLPWEAVDLKHGKITVKQRADENGVIGEPKSQSGFRTINIPPQLVSILRAWKLESGGADLAFPTSRGKPESLANIYNRAWKPIQIAAGVADKIGRDKDGRPILKPRYNFHSLRHFHASMLIADGANPKDIQIEMGHASIQITFDLYGHKFKDDEADKRGRERSERMAGRLA